MRLPIHLGEGGDLPLAGVIVAALEASDDPLVRRNTDGSLTAPMPVVLAALRKPA